MTAYTFETIVAAQALAFDRSADTLTFTTPGTSASNTQVIFDPNHAQVEVISAATGRAVVFGVYFSGVSGIRFPDGTTATIGGSSATPGGGAQAIFGTTTTNTITGGDGSDTIVGAGTADVVAVEYQETVLIFVDSKQDNGVADDLILLPGRTLNDIDLGAFVTTPARPAFSSAGDPQASAVPTVTTTGGGRITGNMDTAHISTLLGEVIDNVTSTNMTISGKVGFILGGSGFAYDVNEQLTGGLINHVFFNVTAAGGVPFQADLSVTPTQAAPFGQWAATDNNLGAFKTLLAGSDRLIGSTGADVIHGYGGDDVIYSYGGADSLFGGDGNDVVLAAIPPGVTGTIGPSSTNLRGGAGADIFHSFGDAGIDRVIDFKFIEGDRVQLDPATQYTLSQSGADTVIDMVGGAKMILVGVTLSSLPSGWIFVG